MTNAASSSIRSTAASDPAHPLPLTSVAVVIPCYNEAEGIETLAKRLQVLEHSSREQVRWQWILVDDGSQDETAARISHYFEPFADWSLLRHQQNQGLLDALKTGFSSAESPWVACLDADCTYDPADLLALVQQVVEHPNKRWDVVTLSPYHRQGRVENVAAWRIGLSRAASRIYRLLFRSPLSCYTCCVRLYRTQLLRELPPLRCRGFVGVTELLWVLDQRGARITEVPATLTSRTTGVSKMRTMRVMRGHFKLMLRMLFARLKPSSPTTCSDTQN